MSDRAKITRRQFVTGSLAVVAAGLGLGLYSTQLEPFWIDVERLPLPIPGLPPSLQGARLVQISDLHVGGDVPIGYILRAFEIVAEQAPDILVITGDLTHDGSADVARGVFKELPQPRLVTACVLGEHDYGDGVVDESRADGVASVMEGLGAVVLRNASLSVSGLRIAGLDEVAAGRFDPGEALSGVAVDGPAIALTHNPKTVDMDGWGAYRGWVLSGHTHGGQVGVPYAERVGLPGAADGERYVSGGYDLGDGRRLYVNRGIGFERRVRFMSRPEVTVFELQMA